MLFKKLFRLLVVGGAILGGTASSGCAARAADAEKKPAPDAGTASKDTGGGASGW
jgi:hypothetical protein